MTETIHACPPRGSGLTPCCGKTPFELPTTDRMAIDPFEVTCGDPAPAPVAHATPSTGETDLRNTGPSLRPGLPREGLPLSLCVEGQLAAEQALHPDQPAPAPAPEPEPGLREQVAAALREAACTGGCDMTEAECAKQRIQPVVWHRGRLAEVSGSPEMFADAVLTVADQEHAALKRAHVALAEQAGKDQAAIARVHAVLISLCREPHPSHGHLCPDDVRRTILNALDQPQEQP